MQAISSATDERLSGPGGRRDLAMALFLILVAVRWAGAMEPSSAMALFREQRYEEALAAANGILAGNRDDAEATAIAGSALVRLERHDEAEPLLRRAVKLAPERAGLRYQLGLIALARADEAVKAGRETAATRHLREAHELFEDELRVAPDLLPALEGRATAAARLGEPAKSIRALEALRRAKPADPASAAALTTFYAEAGRWDDVLRLEAGFPADDPAATGRVTRAAADALLLNFQYVLADPLLSRLGLRQGDPGFDAMAAAREGDLDRAVAFMALHGESGVSAHDVDVVRRVVSDALLVRSIEDAPAFKRDGSAPTSAWPYEPAKDVVLPVLVKRVPVRYPEKLIGARVSGKVALGCVVLTDGAVVPVRVLAAQPKALVRSAVDALRQWRYEPGTLAGKPVVVHVVIVTRYTTS